MIDYKRNTKTVSVIIPSYNQGRYIEEAINSVLQQTYRPLEVIIIDAGSNDNTLDVLHKYDDNEDVKWISELDRGHADGVNKGFMRANGEIIGWLNSDDVYFYRDSISQIINTFNKYPEVDIVYGDSAIISKDSTILRLWLVPPYNKKRITRSNLITQPSVFFRRKVTDAEKLDINLIGLDYEYWLRLGGKGYNFKHIDYIIAGDRHYIQRASVSKRALLNNQLEPYLEKYKSFAGCRKVYYIMDRSLQSIFRLRGFFQIMKMKLYRDDTMERISFPGKFDSIWKQGYRQLLRSKTSVY